MATNPHRFGARAREALGFLTVLGGARSPSPSALLWFAPVGALVGALTGLAWWGAAEVWPLLLAAVLATAVDLSLTGLLHLDGLADSADGLLPHLDRDRRLAVMAAPDVGAFGVGVVGLALLLRVGGIAALPIGWQAVAFVAGVWSGSRAFMAVSVGVLPSARAGSLAAAFAGARPLGPLAVGVILGVAGAATGRGVVGVAALVLGLLAAIGVVALARRRLGGITGDVLGAAGITFETVALVVAAADW